MKLQFGFELEGFFMDGGAVAVPPNNYPTDGFPGLVEARTQGAADLGAALGSLYEEASKWAMVDFAKTDHTFSAEALKIIRKRPYHKSPSEVENIYGKSSRLVGNKTLASFQINISNLLAPARQDVRDGKVFNIPAQYGVFDFVQIIRKLDEMFKNDIAAAGRQPGFYSIKDDCRVEYRSLPNYVANLGVPMLIQKIRACL